MFLFKKKKIETPKAPPSPPIKTKSLTVTGTRYECLYPNRGISSRQAAIRRSKIGDPVSLKEYDYQGDPAIAVLNDQLGCDVGVVKNNQYKKTILNAMKKYDTRGEIIDISTFGEDDDYICQIRIDCYDKEISDAD